MAASRRRFFSGNTLEQALLSAASAFGLDPTEVAYKPVEKKHGFLRVRRRVVIEVDEAAPRREKPKAVLDPVPKPRRIAAERIGEPPPEPRQAESVPKSKPTPDAPKRQAARDEVAGGKGGGRRPDRDRAPRSVGGERPRARQDEVAPPERAVAGGALGEAAAEALGRTLALIDHDVSGRVYEGGERLEVEITGRDSRYFLEQHGKALFALEHVLPKLIRGLSGERAFVKVDCGNFRKDREEELRELAEEVAAEVAESGREETLDWLNPAERRIVHMTLAENSDVFTESEGSGYLKRLTVYPADDVAAGEGEDAEGEGSGTRWED
jgi:spoIIIJ-associated protein